MEPKKTNDAPLTETDPMIEMALAALYDNQPLEFEIEVGPDKKKLALKLNWPDASDEQTISILTSQYCNGLPIELVPDADYEYARARAVIEALAAPEFPEWLPLTATPVDHKGRKVYRPDTSSMKARGVLIGFVRKYYDFYSKTQYLAVE